MKVGGVEGFEDFGGGWGVEAIILGVVDLDCIACIVSEKSRIPSNCEALGEHPQKQKDRAEIYLGTEYLGIPLVQETVCRMDWRCMSHLLDSLSEWHGIYWDHLCC